MIKNNNRPAKTPIRAKAAKFAFTVSQSDRLMFGITIYAALAFLLITHSWLIAFLANQPEWAMITMPPELKILLIYCLLVMLMLVVQSILAVHQHGLRPLVGSRDGIEYTGLADRAIRALNNTLISLVLIIPPVFTLALLSVSTNITTAVLQAFVVVRVGHFIVYLLGISWIRSCLWWTGLLCTVYLYVICLGL